ncbi:MAG: hypothetical protein LBE22_08935 [Azoarcus sp.]|nr:hypothetical protein [Azoarcus sp.]
MNDAALVAASFLWNLRITLPPSLVILLDTAESTQHLDSATSLCAALQ